MSSWDIIKTIKLMIGFIFVLLMISGMLPYGYSWRQQRFVSSKLWLLYAVLANVTFTIYYGRSILRDVVTNEIEWKNAVKLYSYTNILASIACFISQLSVTNASLRFLNQIPLFETLAHFDLNKQHIKSALLLNALKSFAFPIWIGIFLVVRQRRYDPQESSWQPLLSLSPFVISNMIPNCFFGTLIICKFLMLNLNINLESIVQEANYMQSPEQLHLQKPYYRMQRFCDLADRLDILADKYTLICQYSELYVELTGVPVICSLLCNLMGITSGLFIQYLAIADSFINSETYDVFNVLTNSIFLIISLCEIILQANICSSSLGAVRHTGIILQNIQLLHADVRFKQSVESFSLIVLNIKYKIKPLGLLEVDIALLHNVLSAVTSFLLILIQSDLTLRFSLK